MNQPLSFIRSLFTAAFPTKQQPQPTIDSYGQNSSGLTEEQIQPVMEWLSLSLISARYFENAHLIWYNDANPNLDLEQALKEVIGQQEPTFLYHCGDRTLPPPTRYYWRIGGGIWEDRTNSSQQLGCWSRLRLGHQWR